MMSNNTEIVDKDKKSSAAFWISAIALLPIMYVLSIGPAWWFVERYPTLEEPLSVFYFPLGTLVDSNDWLEPMLERYIEWWE